MAKVKTNERAGALISVERDLLAQAAVARATEESVQTGQFFGTKGGVLTFNGSPIKDNKMQVVVVDHILANMYYTGKFDVNNPAPPVCYAFGRADGDMTPHEKSSDKQNAGCRGCPMNDYGTADTGRGKACKNSRRLACISADLIDKPDNILDAQVAYLGVPVTSVKGWAGYVRQVADTFGRPPLGVVTEVLLTPDADKQFIMSFRCIEQIADKKALGLLLAKQKLVANEIAFPFPDLEDMPARQPARKGKGGGKADKAAPAKPQRGQPAAAAKGASGFGQSRQKFGR